MATVTLKALSAHLGLSDGTVSRALNGYTDISQSTRERVEAAALELGYRPNSNARRLATGDAECIGYVVPWESEQATEPFLAELVHGISEALAMRHWDVMLSAARSPEDELAILTRLGQTRRVNGVVISRTHSVDQRVELLKELGLPFVTHGRTSESNDHAWFDVDNFEAFSDAVDHLVSLGHRDIALIGGPEHFKFAADRKAGYKRGLQRARLIEKPAYIEDSEMSLEAGVIAMQRLLALREPPTAVVCISDVVALGAMRAIRQFGWVPGHDISVVGYDGLPIGEHCAPALTTMTQPLAEAGQRIGNMLLAVIDGEDPRQHQVLLRATLERRETDGSPNESRLTPTHLDSIDSRDTLHPQLV